MAVRIKDLPSATASQFTDFNEVRIGIDHVGLAAPQVRQVSLTELHTATQEVRTISMATNQALTGRVTEMVAVRPTVASLTLTVPANKSAVVFNAGPQDVEVVSGAGTTAITVGEWIHVHWNGAAHIVTGPVGGTGAGQTDLTQTRNAGTYTILSSTGTDINLAQVDHIGPGILPSTSVMTISPPSGPPTEFTDYLWGFSHTTTGSVKAFKFDYEMTITGHGLLSGDVGKPIVIRPSPSVSAGVLNDTSSTQFPTGILKRRDANRLVIARPGEVLRIPTLLLEDGNSYSIDTKGRYLFWDLNAASGRSWRATKPVDSNPALPDLVEVLSVNKFGDSTFEARVRPLVPATLLAGSFQPMGQFNADLAGTPSVKDVAVVTSNGATFTNFLNGATGQRITVFANDTTTVQHNSNIQNLSVANLTLNTGQRAQYQLISGVWYQL